MHVDVRLSAVDSTYEEVLKACVLHAAGVSAAFCMSLLNAKRNAIGMHAEQSLALPSHPPTAAERAVIDAVTAADLAPDALYTAPDGSVHVGAAAVAKTLDARRLTAARVLDIALPNTLALDLPDRTLVVLKSRDGRVAHIVEEAGHCRAAPGIHSPTDSMLSPCTSKLNLSKRRHYLKAKPTALFAGMTHSS